MQSSLEKRTLIILKKYDSSLRIRSKRTITVININYIKLMLIDLKFSGNSYCPISLTNKHLISNWFREQSPNEKEVRRNLPLTYTSHLRTPPVMFV